MAIGARTFKIRLDLTSGDGSAMIDYTEQVKVRDDTFAAQSTSTGHSGTKVEWDVQTSTKGDLQLTLMPVPIYGPLTQAWNAAKKNQTLVFVEIEQVPEGAEAPAPSPENPLHRARGIVFQEIGTPKPHLEEKKYDVRISTQLAEVNIGGGFVSRT